jgi:hypothetical protein
LIEKLTIFSLPIAASTKNADTLSIPVLEQMRPHVALRGDICARSESTARSSRSKRSSGLVEFQKGKAGISVPNKKRLSGVIDTLI